MFKVKKFFSDEVIATHKSFAMATAVAEYLCVDLNCTLSILDSNDKCMVIYDKYGAKTVCP